MKICFATNNQNKLKEVQKAIGDKFEIVGLKSIGCTEELPETQTTLEGNSIQKAQFVSEKYGVNCFADDTGLEIKALNGEPGVYSARYAGENCSSEDNMTKVLTNLKGESNRKAQFKTVITLILNGEQNQFVGSAEGNIREEKSGEEGFGYDPIFEPSGYDITFSEMTMEKKNEISHRGKAVRMLSDFLSIVGN